MYLVLRRAWRAYHYGVIYQTPSLCPATNEQPHSSLRHTSKFNEVPVSVHATFEAAEAEAQRLTLLARSYINPFWIGLSWRRLTSLSELEFKQGLAEHDIWDSLVPDDVDDRLNWSIWWDMVSPTWTDQQRHAVWDMLNRIVFCWVREIDCDD